MVAFEILHVILLEDNMPILYLIYFRPKLLTGDRYNNFLLALCPLYPHVLKCHIKTENFCYVFPEAYIVHSEI